MITLTDDVRELLQGPNFAHLATLMPDGSPHSVPLWIDLEGDHVVFFTERGARKARNVDGDARVAISVTAHDNPFVMAMVRGRVVARVDGDAGWALIDRISHKYLGRPYPERSDLVAFLVEPDHALGQAFG